MTVIIQFSVIVFRFPLGYEQEELLLKKKPKHFLDEYLSEVVHTVKQQQQQQQN